MKLSDIEEKEGEAALKRNPRRENKICPESARRIRKTASDERAEERADQTFTPTIGFFVKSEQIPHR